MQVKMMPGTEEKAEVQKTHSAEPIECQSIAAEDASPGFSLKLIAVVFTVSVVLLWVTNALFPCHWESTDDINFTLLFSGVALTVKNDFHNIYSNVLWTFPLCRLYESFPAVPWYPLGLFAAIAVSLTVTFSTLVVRFRSLIGTTLFLAYYFGVAIFAVNNLQYTTTAALLLQSGFILAAHILMRREARMPTLVCAGLLVVAGSLIRYKSFEVGCVLWAGFIALNWLGKPNVLKGAMPWVCWSALVFFACFALKCGSDAFYDRDPAWRTVSHFVQIAGEAPDFRVLECHGKAKTELGAFGVSDNDIALMEQWCYADRDVFSEKRLQEAITIASHGRSYSSNPPLEIVGWFILSFWIVAGLVALAIDSAVVGRVRLMVATTALSILILYLAFVLKFPLRVYLSFLISWSTLLIMLVDRKKVLHLTCGFRKIALPMKVFGSIFAVAVLFASGFEFYRTFLWIPTHRFLLGNAAAKEFISDIHAKPEQLYVMVTPAVLNFFGPWDDLRSYLANLDLYKTTYFSRAPVGEALLAKHGISSFIGCFRSPSTRVIASDKSLQMISTFLNQHYNEQIDFERETFSPALGVSLWRPLDQTSTSVTTTRPESTEAGSGKQPGNVTHEL
jgi:hypothetical protein